MERGAISPNTHGMIEPIAAIVIILSGLGMASGEGGGGARKWVMVAFGLSIAFTAVSFFLNFLGFSGGVAF